jgi:hypothetical protein
LYHDQHKNFHFSSSWFVFHGTVIEESQRFLKREINSIQWWERKNELILREKKLMMKELKIQRGRRVTESLQLYNYNNHWGYY